MPHAEVILINPPSEVTREENYDLPEYPHVGLAYLAGYLEHRDIIPPVIIDGKMQRLSVDEIVKQVAARKPLVVGFSAMTHMVTTAAKMAKRIKAISPRTATVLGGFHGTFLPQRSLDEFEHMDYVIAGEGEIAFTRLVAALRRGEPSPEIPGVWHRGQGGGNAGRGEIMDDLNQLDPPAWHLFDQGDMAKYCRSIPIMSQRGCPFGCNFCSRPYGRVVRQMDPVAVVDHIVHCMGSLGVTNFQFYDETFTVKKNHVANICQGIIERGLDVRWNALVHANTLDETIVGLMKKAGCVEICMGVESGNEDILAAMKKSVTKDKILRAGALLKKAGLPFSGTFIIGHPNETIHTILDTIRFAQRLKPTRPAFGIMVPYPGTLVWEMARAGQGGYRNVSENWDEYNKHYGNAVEMDGLPRQTLELMKLIAYLYAYFYHPDMDPFLEKIGQGLPDDEKAAFLRDRIARVRHDMAAADYDTVYADANKRKAILTFMAREFQDLGQERVYSTDDGKVLPHMLRDELIFEDTSWKTGM